MVHPTPNGLVRHRHSALRQQILDVTQAEGEPEVEPYCLVNDLGRETIPSIADLVHPRWATRPPRTPQAQSAVTMPDQALGDDPRREFVGVVDALATLEAQSESDRVGDVFACLSGDHAVGLRWALRPIGDDNAPRLSLRPQSALRPCRASLTASASASKICPRRARPAPSDPTWARR